MKGYVPGISSTYQVNCHAQDPGVNGKINPAPSMRVKVEIKEKPNFSLKKNNFKILTGVQK